MRYRLENIISELQHNRHTRHIWYWVLSALVCITVFFTTSALVLPGLTMEVETVCGMASHSHSEECCDVEGNLTCPLEEHKHDMACFAHPVSTEPNYICGYLYEHEHTDECFNSAGTLVCSLMEHNHTDECLSVSEPAEDKSTDIEEELGEIIIPFKLRSASRPLKAPADDAYSSNLAELITSVELTDMDGNTVDLSDKEAMVNVGERYRLTIHFDENPDTNHLKQFQYNSEGFLIFDLDAIGLIFDSANSAGGDITIIHEGSTKTIGHYIFQQDSETGKYQAKVWFDDVDDKGVDTPGSNFIDLVHDAGFGLEFAVIFDADDSDDDLNLNLGASWNITLKKNKDVRLTVDKVMDGSDVPFENRYPKFDEATHSMMYKVIVKCTQGAVDHIQYSDSGTVNVLDVEYSLTDSDYSNYSDFVITDLNGNPVAAGDNFDCLSAASGPISKGDGYIIYYKMKIDPPGRDDILDQAAVLYATVDNTVSVKYQNPSDRSEPCDPVESKTSTRVSVTNLSKIGIAAVGTTDSGQKIINWSIIAGDKSDSLTCPFVVTDTIGTDHSFYSAITPSWELIDSDNNVKESGIFTDADFSVNGSSLTFSLPHNTDYRFRVKYSTVTDNDNGGTFTNTAEVLDKPWTVTNSLNVAGGIGSMKKEVTGSDSDYIYFTITANIPHSVSPFGFFFTDKLYSEGESTKIENAAENITVQVEYYDEDGTTVVYDIPEYNADDEYSTTDEEIRFFVSKPTEHVPTQLYAWQMLFFRGKQDQIHHSRSYWYFNKHDCVLTVNYRIPKSAEVFSGSGSTTVRELLASGRRITNSVWFDPTYNATVNYTEPLPVTKRGRVEDYSDGMLLYEVAFTNDVIPLGETNPNNYLPLCENFTNAVFSDNFDEALEYVPGSLMAFVYRRSENTQYCYIGSHFGIADNNPARSPTIEAIFRYDGPVPTDTNINAYWSDFIYEDQSVNFADIFGHYYRSWELSKDVHSGMTLKEFANILKNDQAKNDTAVVFLYKLKIKDEYKLNAHIDMQNEARVRWDQPDSGTYVSPPAVFNIDYDASLVKKEMNYLGGDVVSYEITINPHGMDLTSENTMTVKDEMCEYLSPYMASLKVYEGTPGTPAPVWGSEIDPHALYDSESNTITLTLPDNIPLKITYNCLILAAEEGQTVSLDNSVSINGTPNSVNVNHANVTITASSSSGTGTNHYMYLQKQDNYTQPLNGAKFALYGNKETHKGAAPAGVADEISCGGVTLYYYSSHITRDDSDNAYLHGVIRLEESNDKLESKGLFALVEIEAPYGFEVNHAPMYFYWLDRPEDAVEGVEVCRHEKDYAFVDYPSSYTLPSTGSSGELICKCIAAVFYTVAAVLTFVQIKQKFYVEEE